MASYLHIGRLHVDEEEVADDEAQADTPSKPYEPQNGAHDSHCGGRNPLRLGCARSLALQPTVAGIPNNNLQCGLPGELETSETESAWRGGGDLEARAGHGGWGESVWRHSQTTGA